LSVPEYQIEAKELIIAHLDMALENLPEAPILAAEDLEIAWQLLKQGLPDEPPLEAETETEGTPTPGPTVTPTATP
jgi:hypothetical protein